MDNEADINNRLHSEILNIPCNAREAIEADISGVDYSTAVEYSYKHGHKDARYAAAELSLQTIARIHELEEALGKAIASLSTLTHPKTDEDGCCVACGNWTPAGNPEAHDHESWCDEVRRVAKINKPDLAAMRKLLD